MRILGAFGCGLSSVSTLGMALPGMLLICGSDVGNMCVNESMATTGQHHAAGCLQVHGFCFLEKRGEGICHHRCPFWLMWLKNRGRFLVFLVVQSTTRDTYVCNAFPSRQRQFLCVAILVYLLNWHRLCALSQVGFNGLPRHLSLCANSQQFDPRGSTRQDFPETRRETRAEFAREKRISPA